MNFFLKKEFRKPKKPFEWGYLFIVVLIALVVVYKSIEIIVAALH